MMRHAGDPKDWKEEKLILDSSRAAEKARKCREGDDPLKNIPPSLLSSDHIEEYVDKTGMISPFYRGGTKDRLKKASYEGRIGSKAFIFNEDNELVSVAFETNNSLRVPANNIVFVEADLEFRLPVYIGVRFNLQIRHVHRGLLLGTGPLVDPGYWGKLCIPLHNLTNEDYVIPLEEGLIWIEFTKTTSKPDKGDDALKGDGKEHWEIEKFLRKAARPFAGGDPIGIRSSIPDMVAEANVKADEASKAAEAARDASVTAASDAKAAEGVAADLKNRFQTFSALAVAGLVISLIGLYLTIFFGWRADMSAVWGKIADSASSVGELKSSVGDNGKTIEEVARRLKLMETEIASLRRQGSASDVPLPTTAPSDPKSSSPASGQPGGKN